jgi:hypothetical protein
VGRAKERRKRKKGGGRNPKSKQTGEKKREPPPNKLSRAGSPLKKVKGRGEEKQKLTTFPNSFFGSTYSIDFF